ncbi:MAG: GGDEF domain-containing protein [Nitrospiraceae bacterium]|nr:MAG: GGDEF domain-containing protein [Nitrospiraceae bacterium]
MTMFPKIIFFMGKRSRLTVLLTSVALVGILGTIDHLTGPELSFSVFYTLPIVVATWFAGRGAGVFISIMAALTWLYADIGAGHEYSHTVIPLWNSFVRLAFFIIITILLSIVRKTLEMEKSLAYTDYLTGLKNSRAFYEQVEAEVARSRRSGKPFTIAYFDLDNFKEVNDSRGHEAGDEALRVVASVIRNNLRRSDAVSRLGGDEFAGLFPEADSAGAEVILKNLSAALGASMREHKVPVTFSIGAVTFVRPLDSPKDMIRTVDELMYEVKKKGKNNILHKEYL